MMKLKEVRPVEKHFDVDFDPDRRINPDTNSSNTEGFDPLVRIEPRTSISFLLNHEEE